MSSGCFLIQANTINSTDGRCLHLTSINDIQFILNISSVLLIKPSQIQHSLSNIKHLQGCTNLSKYEIKSLHIFPENSYYEVAIASAHDFNRLGLWVGLVLDIFEYQQGACFGMMAITHWWCFYYFTRINKDRSILA